MSNSEIGLCIVCKEWTEVGNSCCGRGVAFEGAIVPDTDPYELFPVAPLSTAQMKEGEANENEN